MSAMTDVAKFNRVADLIDQYGAVQAHPCGCCLELQQGAEPDVYTMDVDGEETDVAKATKEMAEVMEGQEVTVNSTPAITTSSPLSEVAQPPAPPRPARVPILCIYNDNAYGSNIPKAERALFRQIISAKGQRGKCGNCLRNGTTCEWDDGVPAQLDLTSPVDSSGSQGLFGQRSASLGLAGESWAGSESGGNDWVQDDDTRSLVRRSLRATVTPGPGSYNEARSHRAGSIHSAASSVITRCRRGATPGSRHSTPGSASLEVIRPPMSKATKRIQKNIESALNGTLRHIRMAELAAQQEKLTGVSGGALQELSAGYKKASRGRTLPPADEQERLQANKDSLGTSLESEGEGGDYAGASELPKPVLSNLPRPRATLLMHNRTGAVDDPQRTEDYRLPAAFMVCGDEEARLAEEVRRDTNISLEGLNKARGKGTARAGSFHLDEYMEDDESVEPTTPISARFRKCLGCTLRSCPCEPVELMRSSATQHLEGGQSQADYISEGCRRCQDCGVLCSFSLIPPIYGQWDHLVLPGGEPAHGLHLEAEIEGIADFDQDNSGVDGNASLLLTSNKCTGCRLRNVACMALLLGEGGLGGCQFCERCNVSCSFSLGHPEVDDQLDWASAPKETEKEVEELGGDESQMVTLPPRKPRRKRLPSTTGASSELSSPPDTPMSARTRSAPAKANSVTPVKGETLHKASPKRLFGRQGLTREQVPASIVPHRPPPLILAPLPRRIKLTTTSPVIPLHETNGTPEGICQTIRISHSAMALRPRSPLTPSLQQADAPGHNASALPPKADGVASASSRPPQKQSQQADRFVTVGPLAQTAHQPPMAVRRSKRALPAARTSPVQAFFTTVREALLKIEIPPPAPAVPTRVNGSASSASPPRGVASSEGDMDVDVVHVENVTALATGSKKRVYDRRDVQCMTCLYCFYAPKQLRSHLLKPNPCKTPDPKLESASFRSDLGSYDPRRNLFLCSQPGCNKGYTMMDELRWHRNYGFCPDPTAETGGVRPVPCTVPGCFQSFDTEHRMRQHRTSNQCVALPAPTPPPRPPQVTAPSPLQRDKALAPAIDGVLDSMDIVLAAMNTPPEEVTQNVAIAYGGLSTAIGKLRGANVGVGGLKSLTDVINALDTLGKGLWESDT